MAAYQFVIIENGNSAEADTLRSTIRTRFHELHIDDTLLRFFNEHNVGSRDRKAPTVAAYFGLSTPPTALAAETAALLDDAVVIVPIVSDLTRYSEYAPPALRPINGMEIDQSDLDYATIASVMLESLNLLRKSRRVFISYRRVETRQVAVQLYEELDERSFDVFLDTLSIRPGEPFQEILWHRLADTDVMVLLDSPSYLGSRWTAEELANANNTSIQALQVLWPGTVQSAEAAFSATYELSRSDFLTSAQTGPDARLKDEIVATIAVQVEALRARALAARQAFLTREFCKEAQAAGLEPAVQPNRFIHLGHDGARPVIVVPTVGVPDAVRYHDVESELNDLPGAEILLVYDSRGVRQRWQQHLEWLDAKMTVRSLRVSSIATWAKSRGAA